MATAQRRKPPPVARREHHAKQARAKIQERREKMSGVSGWVADRAGDWSLDAQDFRFLEAQKYFWNPLIDYWFRLEVEGWERLPPPPALLVGIHSGAPFVWDAWTIGIHWWRRFGADRVLHGTAHDALMALYRERFGQQVETAETETILQLWP